MKFKAALAVAAAFLAASPALADEAMTADGMAETAAAPAVSWTGFRLGVHTGFFAGTAFDDYVPGASYTFPASGLLGGFQFGYDQQIGPVVVGLSAEVMWSTIFGDYSTGVNTGSVAQNRTTSILGRVGYATGNYLFYVTGGINFSTVTTVAGPTGGPYDTDTVTFHSGLVAGYGKSIGFGVERAFSHGVSAFAEYRYVFIGDESISLAPTYPGDSHFVSLGGHTLRVGVTVRLGGGLLAGLMH